jgi:hypothetical protein
MEPMRILSTPFGTAGHPFDQQPSGRYKLARAECSRDNTAKPSDNPAKPRKLWDAEKIREQRETLRQAEEALAQQIIQDNPVYVTRPRFARMPRLAE